MPNKQELLELQEEFEEFRNKMESVSKSLKSLKEDFLVFEEESSRIKRPLDPYTKRLIEETSAIESMTTTGRGEIVDPVRGQIIFNTSSNKLNVYANTAWASLLDSTDLGYSQVFFGQINSVATAGNPFPTGWTVASAGAARYTVTHNLGTTAYAIIVTPLDNVRFAIINGRNADDFQINMYDDTGNLNSAASFFLVIR